MDTRENIRQKILELCSEDDYGSWELFWAASNLGLGNDQFLLADTILDLLSEGKIKAKRKNPDSGELSASGVDRGTLLKELSMSNTPNPETFYWFGT